MKVFKRSFIAALGFCTALGVAHADSISASLNSPIPPSGGVLSAIDLTGITTPSQTTVTKPGYTVTVTTGSRQGIVKGSSAGLYAVPVAGVTHGTAEYLTGNFGSSLTTSVANSGNYFSTGLGSITFTFSTPQKSFALLWGSIDTTNALTFNDENHYHVTGTNVQTAASGFTQNGFQGPGGSAYVVVNTTSPFTSVTASSGVVSFEFAAVAASSVAFTPEPSSAPLFALGLSAIVFGAFRRHRSTQGQN